MKLTIDRSALAEIIAHGGSAATRNAVIPITSHVRLIAKGGFLMATSTNLDSQADAFGNAAVEVEGETTVEAGALKQYVDRLPPAAKVKLEVETNKLVVSAGRLRARFSVLPAIDFPTLDLLAGEEAAEFQLKAADLTTLFARTLPAADKSATRPVLEGVFLHVAEGELRAVATNGHVLLMNGIAAPEGADTLPTDRQGRRGVIVSSEAVAAALRLFGREDSIGVTVSARGVEFTGSATKFSAKLVDGTYPDHERVIPKHGDEVPKITLDRASAILAIGSTEVFHDRDAGNYLECYEDRDGLAIEAGAGSDGDGFAVAQAEFEGDVPRFGLSSKYLRVVLGGFGSEFVTLSLADPASPIVFRAEKDPRVVGVVMPMRVKTLAKAGGVA